MALLPRTETYVSDVKDVPQDEHWAVMINETMSYDDGYGEGRMSTKQYFTYIAFANEEALRNWILQNDNTAYGKKTYRVLHVQPATVCKQVTIKIETPLKQA